MVNPAEIVDNLVDLLRQIPELLPEVGGESSKIYAYHDRYPTKSSLALAVHQMPAGSIMVAWEGTAPGAFGSVDVWKHQLAVYLRSRELIDDDPPTGYYRLFRLLTKGVPTSGTQTMMNVVVHASCHPMDPPAIARESDLEGLDFFKVTLSFTEIGDD